MKHIPELLALQNLLDNKIRQTKLVSGDTSQKKIIAFKVEFGEFLNEHRGFKFWSEDQEPRTHESKHIGWSNGVPEYSNKNPLLEEYVDGFHFILSIGLERKYSKFIHAFEMTQEIPDSIHDLSEDIFNNPINSAGKWLQLLEHYLLVGYKVGFTDKQIYEAYLKKNHINHNRQANGY
jgi:dimeric dUTPase (all-alpha-NTP-PPase superfamily)